jgi:hypothetical protein
MESPSGAEEEDGTPVKSLPAKNDDEKDVNKKSSTSIFSTKQLANQ